MYRIRILLIVCVLTLGIFILPVFAGTSVIDGTLTSANLLPNGKPYDVSCVTDPLEEYPPLYYQLRQFQVTASGDYDYRDIGYLDDSDDYGTIDIEVSLYTGSPSGFDPAEPRGNGCFFTVDDTDTVSLTAGVPYTMMITSNSSDPNVGYYIFSLTGPGDVVFIYDACPYPLGNSGVMRSLPNGALAYYAPDLSAVTTFNVNAGTWWTTGTSGEFTRLWIACQASPVWVLTSSLAP